MLASIKKMLDAFEENGISYCHWKSNEHLKEALDGDTDLDVLFDPAERVKLEKVLDGCGLKRFRSVPLMQYNAIEDFIGFDAETAKIWHLHTHYRMTLGEKHLKGYTITPWTSYLLKNRRLSDEGIYISSHECELVLLLVRIALKLRWRDAGKRLGGDDVKELCWLKERADKNAVKKASEEMLGRASSEQILRMLDTDLKKKSQFKKLQSLLRRELKIYTGYTAAGSWFTRTRREIFWLIGGVRRRLGLSSFTASRRVIPSGGCVVSFLGCDGAGKSTTLAYVGKEFNKKIDTAKIYFGSGDGSSSLLRKPMKLVAKKVGGKGVGHAVEKEYNSNKKVSIKARLYSCAKLLWAVTLAGEKKKKLKEMTKARNNGMLVFTDRYPQSIMPGCSDGPLLSKYENGGGLFGRIARWERRIYESAAMNPPDLAVKLMVPTKVAIERKPEMTEDEIEAKKKIVMDMDISENTAVIDTSRDFEITRSEVMSEIWKVI